MYKLILMLFITALMFGCSKEEAGDAADSAMESAGEMADEAMDKAGDMAEDAGEMVEGDSFKGPKLEPLPDWDSLPPIEEEMGAEDGSTMMEKEEVVEKSKEHAGDEAESEKEMMKKE